MCRKNIKRLSFLLIALFTVTHTRAQLNDADFATRDGETAPYSRFGIGEQRSGTNVLLRGMGGISSAYAQSFAVNTDNPASYASLRLTTYEAGGEGSTRVIQTANGKFTSGMGSLSYLTVGIPVGKHAGVSFGVRPQTRVFYQLRDTVASPGVGSTIYNYKGSGSTNYAFIGAGGKYKGFSIGFNAGYMFGTIVKDQNINVIDTINANNSVFRLATRIGGIYWKGGAMYDTKLNTKYTLRVGGTFTLSQDLTAKRDEYWYSESLSSSARDTVYSKTDVKNSIVMPASYSFGAQIIGTDKWMAGFDVTTTQWSQFRNFGSVDSVADNIKVSVGGEYTPNINSIHKYFERVTYRLGAYYGTDYIYLRNTSLPYYAVTAGISLPFRRSTDRIHTAVEVGKRGTTANGLIQENFVRLSLAISLNDKWFIKRKYE